MADNLVINGKVVIDSSGAEVPLKNIKKELKEAQVALQTITEVFGETSIETVNAAKKVAQLKDQIGDAKALTEAFSPDKKFQAFSQALSGVAGGFAAVQGAQALFGTESKALEETLVKVNAAMALSQGLSAVTESIDAFKNLGTVLKSNLIVQKAITAAQWLWNAAMAANPVGAVIVAITALIAGVVALTKYFMDNADAAKAQAKEIDNSRKAIEKQRDVLKENAEALDRNQKFQLDYAKASGKSAEEIRKLEIALINKKIAEKEAAAQTALATVELEKNRLATLRSAGAADEQIKAQEENIKAARENLKSANEDVIKSGKERQDIINRQAIEIKQAETNAIKESEEKQKAASQKSKEISDQKAKDRIAAEAEADKQLQAAKDANYLQAIKDDKKRAEEKIRIDFENSEKEINDLNISQTKKNALITELTNKKNLDLAAIDDEYKKKQDEKNKQEEEKKKQELLKQAEFEDETFKILNETRINNIQNQFDKQRELEEINYQNQIDSALEALNNKEITEAEYAARREALKTQHEANLTEIEKNQSEERKKVAELEAQARENQLNGIGNALQNLSQIAGEQTGVGKALAVASTTISTYSAAQKAYESAFLPVPNASSPALGAVFAGVAVAQGLLNIKKILSTNVPGKGGSKASGGSLPSVSSVTPPIPPQLATTTMNQSQINQLSSATTRAFVLESDVTSNQERIIRLNRAARIN